MDHREIPPLRRFIVLEGVDGSGTTTALHDLGTALAARGIPAWTTCEPSGLPTGQMVRQALRREIDIRPETLARLFSADRHEHLHGPGGILERLGRGETVISDRYLWSSLAYQGISCGPELPRLLNAAFPLPELLLYFDVAPSISMGRVEDRGSRELFEELPIQLRVREAYRRSLEEYRDGPTRIVHIDASLPLEAVRALARAELGRTLRIDPPL